MKKRMMVLAALRYFVFIVLIAMFFQSCAIGGSPTKTYLAANEQFTSLVTQYNFWFKLQTLEVQQKWIKEIDPKILEINQMFREWRKLLNVGSFTGGHLETWNNLKVPLINLLIRAGVIKEE